VIPPGEYYLRMGFRNVLYYSLNIYFNDVPVVKGLALYSTGADFNMDRFTGYELGPDGLPLTGYPEWIVLYEWEDRNISLGGYDGDGAPVGIVTVTEEGHYTIRLESDDHARLWKESDGNTHLMFYHWCLRPTKNNY
jgi:hypothetical protein